MRRHFKIFALLSALTVGGIITANYIVNQEDYAKVTIEYSELTPSEIAFVEDYDYLLYGGKPVGPGELIPSVWIGNCTATVVSENVIITAAHCKANNSAVAFNLLGKRHTGRCTQHPQYSQNGWLNNDFALCKFAPPAILENYGDLAPQGSKVGDIITMQGYGQGSNGRLNWGNGVIARMTYMDIVTSGRLSLGSGDSGGALFSQLKDRKAGPFRIIGINSRGGRGTSLFNITSLERSQKFFEDYAEKNAVEICGVTKDCITPDENPDNCHVERGLLKDLENDLFFAISQKDACTSTIPDDAGPTLINGQLAKPEEWEETLRITIGNSGCSATLVAPNVILSAAHCGAHGSRVRTMIAGKAATGTCYRHPSYPRQDVDLLACKLDQSFPGVKPATVAVSHGIADVVTLAGFGCTQPSGGGSDGRLRYGNAKIIRYSAYDIISSQGSALCYGDSGGPMFKRIMEPGQDPKMLIGVNSKGNIRDTSYNTRLDLKTSQDFLRSFEMTHKVKICGISANCNPGNPINCGMERLILEDITKKIATVKEIIGFCER